MTILLISVIETSQIEGKGLWILVGHCTRPSREFINICGDDTSRIEAHGLLQFAGSDPGNMQQSEDLWILVEHGIPLLCKFMYKLCFVLFFYLDLWLSSWFALYSS